MVQAFSNKAKSHEKEIENLIINHNIGGIIFSKGGPIRQARLTNRLQSVSEVPLLIGMDAMGFKYALRFNICISMEYDFRSY